jgi:hypothetical protein
MGHMTDRNHDNDYDDHEDDDDADLGAGERELARSDAYFGALTFNRRGKRWETEAEWLGHEVRLTVSGDGEDLEEALRNAQKLWEAQDSWSTRVKEYAVTELFELKNDDWLEEDEEEVTPEQFKARMRLESITMDADGEFEFWYADGDLFWGHSILVSGSLDEGPNDADIPG